MSKQGAPGALSHAGYGAIPVLHAVKASLNGRG